MGRPIVVAIDGPAGAGKSTIARELARRLGYVLVDTGALYRGVALAARARGISWDDGQALGALAQTLDLRFESAPDGTPLLRIDGADCAAEIRAPDISMGASHVSRHPEVRQALLGIQQRLGQNGGVVLEGRDIGTVVFPQAEVKIFLTASPEIRAHRRVDDLKSRGMDADFETTLRDVRTRDDQDQNRTASPLKPAPDSVVVDSTGLGIDDVIERVVQITRAVGA